MVEHRMKRCTHPEHEGVRLLPATEEFFYGTTSRGKTHNKFGERYLRGWCKECKKRDNSQYAKKRGRSEEEKKRLQKMQRARRRAYARLAAINEAGFMALYAEELLKEGIRLEHYNGPNPREESMAERDERKRSRRLGRRATA